MFGERWKQNLSQKGDEIALWYPEGALTFRALETAARALKPQVCPVQGEFYLAQGDGVEITLALLAGFLTGRPVQVVEKDRQRRVPASAASAALVAAFAAA